MKLNLTATERKGRFLVTAPGGDISGVAKFHGKLSDTFSEGIDVELEVPGSVPWCEILVGVGNLSTPDPLDDALRLRGLVMDVDQHAVLTLGVMHSVVLIETVGEPPLSIVGCMVEMMVNSAEMYPMDI